mmetsp:Transcript_19354/g.68471  ORF Transcript_19354/g.68471 Transcript_19354/m.68471 type:complete len:379 (-) Transcript_19354:1164-2300(-)
MAAAAGGAGGGKKPGEGRGAPRAARLPAREWMSVVDGKVGAALPESGVRDAAGRARDGAVRVATWNVLADGLAQESGFVHVTPSALSWETRCGQVVDGVVEADADIVLLQEVNHFEDSLEPAFARLCGMAGRFLPKASSPCAKFGFPSDGSCVLWRADRFEAVDGAEVQFCDLGEADGARGADHSQRALVVVLREIRAAAPSSADEGGDPAADAAGVGGARVVIAVSTHLKASSKPTRNARRLSQMRQLLAALGPIAESYPGASIVLGADLNEAPLADGGGVYEAATEASALDLASAYGPGGPSTEPEYSTYAHWPWGWNVVMIDYVLYSRPTLKPVSVLRIPLPDEVGRHGIPSRAYPSDHFLLAAEFKFLDGKGPA